MNKVVIVFSILFAFVLNDVESSLNGTKKLYDPKKITNCKAQLDDGKIIDLSSLDNANSPK